MAEHDAADTYNTAADDERIAPEQRLRVRRDDAASHEPRDAGRVGDHAGRHGMGGMEVGAVDPQLPASDARLAREPDQRGRPERSPERRNAGQRDRRRRFTARDGASGTFLGSSDIEGFQAGMMLTLLDNAAVHWLTALMTTDGATLGGFADLDHALAYDELAPLRWFPAEIAVSETANPDCFMPRPTGLRIRSPDSHLLDLDGMLGTFASVYALTDRANAQVGGSQPVIAYFDGDPFPADNQIADGEPTLHDRALGLMRVTLVNILRLHIDPASGILVDDVTVASGTQTRGTTLSTPTRGVHVARVANGPSRPHVRRSRCTVTPRPTSPP